MSGRTLLTLSALALAVLAKRDLAGCTSIATTNQWGHASMLYYLPGTGEICELLDCGGGRAPVKYDTPGCAGNPYVPKFLPNYNPATQTPEATPEATPAPETPAEEEEEEEPTYEDEYEVEPVEPSSSVPSQTAAPEYPAETPAPTDAESTMYITSMITATISSTVSAAPSQPANGTATYSTAAPSAPAFTGAANVMGVSGLLAAVAGLAML